MNEFKDLIAVLKDILKELSRIRKNQEKQMETLTVYSDCLLSRIKTLRRRIQMRKLLTCAALIFAGLVIMLLDGDITVLVAACLFSIFALLWKGDLYD